MTTPAGKRGRKKSREWESNPQPTVYKTVALPVELSRREYIYFSIFPAPGQTLSAVSGKICIILLS